MKLTMSVLIAAVAIFLIGRTAIAGPGTITVNIHNNTPQYIIVHMINRTTKSAVDGHIYPYSSTTLTTATRSLGKSTDLQNTYFVTNSSFQGLGQFINCYITVPANTTVVDASIEVGTDAPLACGNVVFSNSKSASAPSGKQPRPSASIRLASRRRADSVVL